MFTEIEIKTRDKVDLVDITARVQDVVDRADVTEGTCFVYCPHTTSGIVLNENWDASVERDLAMVLDRTAPQDLSYDHGEGNAPAHVKSVLVGSDHFIFVRDGKLQMGRWQGVFFAEFDGPRRRTLWIKVVKDDKRD
jgi:secondary thiamine-phosphate synthase enzyme